MCRSRNSIMQVLKSSANKRKSKLELAKLHNKLQVCVYWNFYENKRDKLSSADDRLKNSFFLFQGGIGGS